MFITFLSEIPTWQNGSQVEKEFVNYMRQKLGEWERRCAPEKWIRIQ